MSIRTRRAHCSFCRKSAREAGPLVEGYGDVFICGECADLTQDVLQQEKRRRRVAPGRLREVPSLEQIRADLHFFLGGQPAALQAIATAAHRHYASSVHGSDRSENHPILLLGRSASSRFLLVRVLAYSLNVPGTCGEAEAVADPHALDRGIEHPLLKLLNASEFDLEAAQTGLLYLDKLDEPEVQRAFLAILSGDRTGLPNRFEMDTSNVFFIAGGMFPDLEDNWRGGQPISSTDLINHGMDPELAKRFGTVISIGPVEEEVLTRVLGWVNLAGALGESD